MKIRVTLYREYEIDCEREELEELGIDEIEKIDDMSDLDEIEERARTITTWIEPGTVEVVEKEEYKCPDCGLDMLLYDDEVSPCPGCGGDPYKPKEE